MGWEPPTSTGEDQLADCPQASVSVSVERGWGDVAHSLGQTPVHMLPPIARGRGWGEPESDGGQRGRGRSVP